MPEIENEFILDDMYGKADSYMTQLQTLQQQLPSILDEFQKAYLFYNSNPQNNEYQQTFNNINGNLNNLNSQLFMLSNEVQSNTDEINKKLFEVDKLIKREKTKNNKLNRKVNVVEDKYNASHEMISDYKQTYDIGYLRNWGLLLSIVVAGFAISKVYANKHILIK